MDAAARGVVERLFGLVAEVIEPETVKRGTEGEGERASVSRGADKRANTMGWRALERGHVAPIEPTAQLGDAHGGVGAAAATIQAAELVPGQAATRERGVSMGADTKANTLGRWLTPGWQSLSP